MKLIKRFLSDVFDPKHDIDIQAVGEALNDPYVRTAWLEGVLFSIKSLSLEIDKRLWMGNEYKLSDLCARRRAYQEILESVLSAKRQKPQAETQNQFSRMAHINLDKLASTLRRA